MSNNQRNTMTTRETYNSAPRKIIGKTKKDAMLFLINEGCLPFAIEREDRKVNKLEAGLVQITMNIQNGVVVGAALDGRKLGQWP
jgi:hypothetical protein